MNDNVIAYILSLVCIIFILIEIVSVNKKERNGRPHRVLLLLMPFVLLHVIQGGWWSSIYLVVLSVVTYIHSFGNLGVPICQNHCCQTYKTEK